MSMLSAMRDRLRERADDLERMYANQGIGQRDAHTVRFAASDMRDAADTIWELRDDLQRANAENARLRDELESVGTAAYLYGRSDLKDENAKLRELCIDLFDRLRDEDKHCGECRLCEYDAWNFGDPKCIYAKRMRELVVEV